MKSKNWRKVRWRTFHNWRNCELSWDRILIYFEISVYSTRDWCCLYCYPTLSYENHQERVIQCWIDFIFVVYAKWHHRKFGYTQLESATFNQMHVLVSTFMFGCSGTKIYDPWVEDEGSSDEDWASWSSALTWAWTVGREWNHWDHHCLLNSSSFDSSWDCQPYLKYWGSSLSAPHLLHPPWPFMFPITRRKRILLTFVH